MLVCIFRTSPTLFSFARKHIDHSNSYNADMFTAPDVYVSKPQWLINVLKEEGYITTQPAYVSAR